MKENKIIKGDKGNKDTRKNNKTKEGNDIKEDNIIKEDKYIKEEGNTLKIIDHKIVKQIGNKIIKIKKNIKIITKERGMKSKNKDKEGKTTLTTIIIDTTTKEESLNNKNR
jgi:hypothetical protein